MSTPFFDDPWLRTIRLLTVSVSRSGLQDTVQNPITLRQNVIQPRTFPGAGNPTITVLERVGPTTVIVAWRDSTLCCYGDQVWRAGIARCSGNCALSGNPILRGNSIYRPSPRNPPCSNASEMILSTVVDETLVSV